MSSADRILKFLRSYTDRHGRPPTVREIQRAVGFKSPRAVSYFLDKLEKAQWVTCHYDGAPESHTHADKRGETNVRSDRAECTPLSAMEVPLDSWPRKELGQE